MRTALKASLATLDRETGHPYPSLVLVATEPDSSPILLISRLALHTRNLDKDGRAAILFDGTDGLGDPLAGGRVTVSGEMQPTQSRALCAASWRAMPPRRDTRLSPFLCL